MTAQTENTEPVALVTGAFSGIGLATSAKLATGGWRVHAGGRRLDRADSLLSAVGDTVRHRVTPHELDVTDDASIARALDRIAEHEGRLDLVVNNAGSLALGPITETSPEELRQLIDTNVLGVQRITRAALPLMLRTGRGRFVNVSSLLGRVVLPGTGAYSASKYALEALTDALRMELGLLGPNFFASLVEPGQVRTGFWEGAEPGRPVEGGPSVYGDLGGAVANFWIAGLVKAPSPETVADVVYRAATAGRPKARYVATGQARLVLALRRLATDRIFDRLMIRTVGATKVASPSPASEIREVTR
jgi:NAD(P)-dependent dehydrogenase (short-subunit alcohol dehydrogenase family)